MEILPATKDDHTILTAITFQSKAFWGYSAAQMALWKEALTITATYIQNHRVYKLTDGNRILGYYAYFAEEEGVVRMDNLFVLPDEIGKGFGRLLMKDFIARIRAENWRKIILEAEPHAEKFYQKQGFITTGMLETAIPGRFLPIMELELPAI